MPVGPDILCRAYRDSQQSVGVLKGGTIFQTIGQPLLGVATRAGSRYYTNLVARYSGLWWAMSRGCRVYRYSPDTDRWQLDFDPTGRPTSAEQAVNPDGGLYALHGGIYVGNRAPVDGNSMYCHYEGNTSTRDQFLRFNPFAGDGAWSGPFGAATGAGAAVSAKALFYKGLAYYRTWRGGSLGAGSRFSLAGSVSQSNVAQPARLLAHASFFSLDDRIFLIGPLITTGSGFAQVANVEEFALGVWSHRDGDGWDHNFGARDDGIPAQDSPAGTGVLRLGDAAYVFGGGNNLNATIADGGIMCVKLTVPVPGGPIVFADISNPVIPAVLRPQVGGGGTDPRESRFECFVDDQTDPANPVGYVIWTPAFGNTTNPTTLFRFNGEGVEMTQVGVMQADSNFAFPDAQNGMGAYMLAPPTSTPLLEGYLVGTGEQGPTGVELAYQVAGDPMLLEFVENDMLLKHGVVTGGPFQVGEVVTSSINGATGTVSVVGAGELEVAVDFVDGAETFQGGEVITGGTSGATAILNIPVEIPYSGGPFQVAEVVRIETLGGVTPTATVVAVNVAADGEYSDLEISAPTGAFIGGFNIIGATSATRSHVAQSMEHAAGRVLSFIAKDTLTGGTSGATGSAVRSNNTSAEIAETVGSFQAGEVVTGSVSGSTRTLASILRLGIVNGGPLQVGEVITGGTSGATGVVTRQRDNWNGYGTYVAYTVTAGAFVTGEVITGGTSGATATTASGPLANLGGAATHTARFRFHLGSGPTGKGTPDSPGGICTLVVGSATGGASVVVGNDVQNIAADKRTLYRVQWDFLADGVQQTAITDVKVETVRG